MNRDRKPNPRRPDSRGVNRAHLASEWSRPSDAPNRYREERSGRSVVPFSRLRSLVVPLDGTPFAEHALPHALAIARRSGAALRLVHVHSLLDSVSSLQQYYSDDLISRLRRQKEGYLQSVVRRVRRRIDSQITSLVIESGDISQSLCESVASDALVVMASHGRGRLGRLLYGGVADQLMRTLPCPLLIVRGKYSAVDLTDDPMPRHVLIPLDGTNVAETVVDSAATIGWLSGAQFTLAHFQDLEPTFGRSELVDAHGYMLNTAKRIKEGLPAVNPEVVISDRCVSTAILSLVEEQAIDLIALTTRRRSKLSRLVKPSIADSVVRRAKTPVLVLRPSIRVAELHERAGAFNLE